MPQKVIKFTGINRMASNYANGGACEELINARPTPSGMKIVKPKLRVFNDPVDFDVYEHSAGSETKLIGIRNEYASGGKLTVYDVDSEGNVAIKEAFDPSSQEYDVATVGQYFILTCGRDMRVYELKSGTLSKVNADVPSGIKLTYTEKMAGEYVSDPFDDEFDPKSSEFKDAVLKNWSAAIDARKSSKFDDNITYGCFMVALNFEMNDGTEFWTTSWTYVNPYLKYGSVEVCKPMDENNLNYAYAIKGHAVSFKIPKIEKSFSILNGRSLVKNINVYATRQMVPYDIENMYMSILNDNVQADVLSIAATGVTDELLYFQKSFPLDDLYKNDIEFTLNIGHEVSGERILEVDAGAVTRSGKVVSFNGRAHLFDSYSRIHPQEAYVLANNSNDFESVPAYVEIDNGGETLRIGTTARINRIAKLDDTIYDLVACYPDARAKRLYYFSSQEKWCYIDLNQSSRYNYAYGEAEYMSNQTNNPGGNKPEIRETDAINVSAINNPFVFPVENSYAVGGRVMDIEPAYTPVSSTQIGQYPLTVFTSNGIFSLEQGSGSVLYGSLVPIQPHAATGKALATPHGTFFKSSAGLYLLIGRDAVCVSDVLIGNAEQKLRDNEAYNILYMGGSDLLVDFYKLLSSQDFDKYLQDASLSYDQLNNELIISSSESSRWYSYVFSLETKAFHKISKKVFQHQAGSRYAMEVVGDNKYLIDLSQEQSSKNIFMMQSRPMSLEAMYTHIKSLLLQADASLGKDEHLSLSVFGSDNLEDWKCIILSQKTDVAIRHIRTNRAPKSYRDYVIIVSGYSGTDTDISDIIADYSVVSRR